MLQSSAELCLEKNKPNKQNYIRRNWQVTTVDVIIKVREIPVLVYESLRS